MTMPLVRRARPEPDAALRVRSVARSHVGLIRAVNEDRVLDAPQACLWAVADGMGGHCSGDLAAQAAVDQLRTLTTATNPVEPMELRAALEQTQARLVADNRAQGRDAGTTIVVAALTGTTVQIAWVGDSRAYRLRDGRLEQLTRDHSVVQELVDAGLIDAAMAERHPQANVVTRALGVAGAGDPDFVSVTVRSGDRLLLCSDGLSRTLAATVAGPADCDRLADALLADALARDGSDNISLIVVAFDD